MHPPSPPHSSPEETPRLAPKSRSHSASSPEQGRPDIKRPRSSLSNSTRSSSASLALSDLPDPEHRHRPTFILPPPACPAHFPTPALTPESTFPTASTSSHAIAEQDAAAAARGFVKRDDLIQRAVDKVASEQRKAEQHELLQAEKDRFVNGLVGASVLAIESIWGPSSPSSSTSSTHFTTSSTVLPLQYFVREVLRRSRTSCSTLQLALYYLHKSRKTIRDAVAAAQASKDEIQMLARGERERLENEEVAKIEEDCMGLAYFEGQDAYPSPPESPRSTAGEEQQGDEEVDVRQSAPLSESLADRLTRLLELQKSPLLCGRRMFLASLISASKYLQDRNYSNKAWCKISGLEIKEINANERAFLELVGWELHLKAEDFRRWTERLNTLTSTTSSPMSTGAADRRGLARTASEYLPSPPTSSPPASNVRPTTSNLLRSKLALTRGNSAPQLESSTARSCGFPIAQPTSSSSTRLASQRVRPVEVAAAPAHEKDEELETTEEEDNAVATVARPVRALPVRRVRLGAHAGIPSAWKAGASVGRYSGEIGRDIVRAELVAH